MDRLEEIQKNFNYDPSCTLVTEEDIAWLISEIESLRAELEGRVKMALDAGRGIGEETANQRIKTFDLEVIALHRPCTGVEHNPNDGKQHGYCVRCVEPWPCTFSPERNWNTGGMRPITEEDLIRESNKSYDLGRKHGHDERTEELKGVPEMLEIAADFFLQYGDLDKNATGLSALLLRNKAQAIRRLMER